MRFFGYGERGLKPGLYKYDGTGDLKGHRFHLRVDSERNGVLMVDASKLIFLNGTALDYVRCLLEGKGDDETVGYMRNQYKGAAKEQVVKDYRSIAEGIHAFVHGEENVMHTIGSETPVIGEDRMPSPYRLDLALTYKCQNVCEHCYNEKERQRTEMTTGQWRAVIKRAADVGVPHIVFTGGEPTLHPALRELIVASEEQGQITGLITNGRALAQPGYLADLVKAGLDHVQITLLSHIENVHDAMTRTPGSWKETVEGIKAAVTEDLYVSTNTTILASNSREIENTMRFIASLGVRNVAFNSIIRSGEGKGAEGLTFGELKEIMQRLTALAGELKVKLIWYSPTPYCEFNPVNMGLGIKQCTACSINMAVEPDGTVLPCQSYYEPLGNILDDPWEKIWDHELCKKLRERKYLPEKCKECDLWDTCGGGCPLAYTHPEYMCLDRHSSM